MRFDCLLLLDLNSPDTGNNTAIRPSRRGWIAVLIFIVLAKG